MSEFLSRPDGAIGKMNEQPITILGAGSLSPEAVIVKFVPKQYRSSDFLHYAAAHWRDQRDPKTHLWAPLSGLRRTLTLQGSVSTGLNNQLLFAVAPGLFYEVDALKDQKMRELYEEDAPTVNPIATSIVVVTKDNRLLVATKENDGTSPLEVISGYPDVLDDFTRPDKDPDFVNDTWNPFLTVARELKEETGITSDELSEINATGVIFNNHPEGKVTVVTFVGKTPLLSTDFFNRENCGEINVRFIENSEATVASLILLPYAVNRTGKATLLMYGREAFGEKWFTTVNQNLNEMYNGQLAVGPEKREVQRIEDLNFLNRQLIAV